MGTVAKTPASSASTAPTVAAAHDRLTRPASTLWRDAARRFFRNKLAVGALVVMVLLILVAIFADVIAPAPYDYSVLAEANQFPNATHLLGTDPVGRDFLSRLIYGARVSLTVGFSVQAIALLIGVPLGTLAGMRGGWVDYVIMRGVEVLTAVPIWLFALFIIAVWRSSDSAPGSGLINVIVAIGLIGWVDICRLTARPTAVAARERLCTGRLRNRRDAAARCAATPVAQRPDTADRLGHAGCAHSDLHRGRTELPGLRHQRPAAKLGQDGGRVQLLYPGLLVPGALPYPADRDHDALLLVRRRRSARCSRSAAQQVMGLTSG